ncbi:MAG: arylesterase [Yoonia sp.]|nr:arylesterase [Yoonia sp.]MDG1861687.1 arylesterase [Yoonia sp.]
MGYRLGYGAARSLRNLSLAIGVFSGAAYAETVTIAALGDSLTAGYGLPRDQGFVPQLQAWLEAAGADAVILNAGVSGDTTAGGLSRVDWTLTPDVDAMILTLGGNDYLRGLDPAVSRANLEGILQKAVAAEVDVLVVGLTAGANYGPEFKTAFDAMYADLAAQYAVPLFPTFFAGLLAEAGTQDAVLQFMQSDGIHPNEDGVKLIVAAMGPSVLELVETAR